MITDIVRILQTYSESKSYIFHYGRKAVLNLIDTGDTWTGELDDIYFLLEYRKGKPIKNATATGSKGTRYEGTFYLVKHSDLDQNFIAEVGTESQSKYVNNIEPLISAVHSIESYFGCSVIDWETVEFDDVTDILDMNCDGLMVRFVAYIPLNYTLPNDGSSTSN